MSRIRRRGWILAGLLALLVLTAGCDWLGSRASFFSDEEHISVPPGAYDTLVVENRAGTIRILPAEDDRLSGILHKKMSGSAATTLRDVAASVTTQVETDGGTVRISEVFRTDDRVDFWSWKDSDYPDVTIGLEYELYVPSGVRVVEIRQTAGNTHFDQYEGAIVAVNNAGNITLDKVRLEGDSRIALVSGNLTAQVTELDADASLTAELTAGNIELQLPENLGYRLYAGVEAGTISGDFDPLPVTNSSVEQQMGTGGPPVTVQVESGNIRITHD